MSDTLYVPARLEIGSVIRQTFSVIGRHFGTFLLLSVVFVGVPRLAVALVIRGTALGDPNTRGHITILVSILAAAIPFLAGR